MAEETFGLRLKRLREEAGLTQAELAEKIGLHRLGVSKLERDEYGPTWAQVRAISKALGTTCSAFEDTVEPGEGETTPRPRGRPRKQSATEQEPEPQPKLPEPEKPARRPKKDQ
jgi:putative transcriptional regulator